MNIRVLPVPDPVHELDLSPEVIHISAPGSLTVEKEPYRLTSFLWIGIDLRSKGTEEKERKEKRTTEWSTRPLHGHPRDSYLGTDEPDPRPHLETVVRA